MARPAGTVVDTGDELVALDEGRLPAALADLHRRLGVGDRAVVRVGAPIGRQRRADLVEGAGFSRGRSTARRVAAPGDTAGVAAPDDAAPGGVATWHLRREHSLADTVAPGMRLLLCGLNPSPYAADVGVGFARPGNRFWPAALASGIVSRDRDPIHALEHHGVGMTDLVKRATARADQVDAEEFRVGAQRVRRLVQWLAPGAVCFVGLTGYRIAVDPHATAGEQPQRFGGVPTYVMPNPSGLNAHVGVADLAAHLRAAAALA